MKTIVSKVLAFVVCIAFLAVAVSATLTVTENSVTLNGSNQATLNILSDVSGPVSLNSLSNSLSIISPTSVSLVANVSQAVIITATPASDTKLGSNTATVNVSMGASSDTVSVVFTKKYCDTSISGNSSSHGIAIKKFDITNHANQALKGWGDDDDSWYPGDDIEVEVKIENNNPDEKIKNIEVEWGLYNQETGEFILDDNENDFDLKHGDDKTITFSLNANPDDFDEDQDDYTLFVRATGDDEESGVTVCAEDSQAITVNLDSDFVVLRDVKLPESVSCPVEFTVSADVWNIGSDDQDDVRVNVYNKELGIDEDFTIGDINTLDSERLDATIKASASNIASKIYGLEFTVLDEDNDVYQNDNDDESKFTLPLTVNCAGGSNTGSNTAIKPSVSAQVVSGGNAGEELSVKTTITNVAATQANYDLVVSGYTSWASDVVISDRSVALAGGASREVTLTFKVKDGAEGEQSFAIELLSSGTSVARQPVVVSIKEASSFGGINLGSNWYLWAIAAVNIILVLAIIIVAVRIVRKRKEPAIDEAF